jgi:hypothetical protein
LDFSGLNLRVVNTRANLTLAYFLLKNGSKTKLGLNLTAQTCAEFTGPPPNFAQIPGLYPKFLNF